MEGVTASVKGNQMNLWCLEIPIGWWEQFGPDLWADTENDMFYWEVA